jgi:hypothetical protein
MKLGDAGLMGPGQRLYPLHQWDERADAPGQGHRRIAVDCLPDRYRVVPIPFDKTMIGDYLPATLTHEDYPNLIAAGESVDTVATGTLMIAYNWPKNTDRYRRIDDFVKRFFPRLSEFQKPPRNEKWRETNLFATVPTWKRCPVAEEWLRNDAEQLIASQREQFQDFVAKRQASRRGAVLSDAERTELFGDFVKWIEAQRNR